MMKYPAKTDIAVLLLFFTRSDTFRQVFEAVRQARPSKLFLYQDGPRGERDMKGIEACREICSDAQIDWQCEVHRRYLDHNEGCDPSGFRSHQWAFSLADKVIVLEDDVVPSQSFFPFCKEMLDRYEHDERISMVAGFNIDEQTRDCGADSYFFTTAFSIWGWASWRRVAQRWDPSYAFMHDPEMLAKLERVARERHLRSDMLQMFRDHSQSGKAYFETIYWADMLLHDSLAIMPRENQINNIGLTGDSTHFSAELKTTPTASGGCSPWAATSWTSRSSILTASQRTGPIWTASIAPTAGTILGSRSGTRSRSYGSTCAMASFAISPSQWGAV